MHYQINNSRTNFRFFLCGSASALFGTEIFYFVVPLIALTLGYSSIVAGWCSFAFFAPVIGGKLLAGPIVERSNKRSILLLVEAGRLISVALLSLGLYLFPEFAVALLLIAAFSMGTLSAFTDTAEPSLLKTLLTEQGQTAALSTYEVRTRIVQLIGPSVGGVLLSVAIFIPLIASQISSLVAVLFYRMVNVTLATESKNFGFREGIISAAKWMVCHRMFFVMVLLTSLNNFIHPILYLTVVYNAHEAGYDPGQIGLILAGLGAGGIAGSLASPLLARHLTTDRIVLLVNILRVGVFVGFAVWGEPLIIFLLFVCKAILGGAWNVCFNVYTINAMPYDYVARLSSLSSLIIKCCTALGSLAAGYSIAVFGSPATLWILVLLTILMFVCSFGVHEENDLAS